MRSSATKASVEASEATRSACHTPGATREGIFVNGWNSVSIADLGGEALGELQVV